MPKNRYVFLSLLLLLFAVSCGNNSDMINPADVVNNPNTANGTVNAENLPVFNFKEEEYDFGRIGQGEVVTHIFKFTNTGKSGLVISSAKASCGCTVADYPQNPVKPGQEGDVSVSFDSEGKKGMQHKTVTISANTQPGTKVLTIKAEVVIPEQQ